MACQGSTLRLLNEMLHLSFGSFDRTGLEEHRSTVDTGLALLPERRFDRKVFTFRFLEATPTLPKFHSSPLKIYLPNRKVVFLSHHFSGASCQTSGVYVIFLKGGGLNRFEQPESEKIRLMVQKSGHHHLAYIYIYIYVYIDKYIYVYITWYIMG